MRRAMFVFCVGCTNAIATPETVTLPVLLPSAPPSHEVHAHIANVQAPEDTTFTSERGIVRLAFDGDAATGAYSNGVVTCNEHGDVLACEWFEASAQGHATFHRRTDGRLEGTYGNAASDSDLGAWTLTPIPPSNSATLDGPWDTNWGLATLKETRGALHVDYPSGQMDCTRRATNLDCTWVEGSLAGTAQFTIESRALRGSWTTSAGLSGVWVFVRR